MQVAADAIARYVTAVTVIGRLIVEMGPKSGVSAEMAAQSRPKTAVSAIVFREQRRVPARCRRIHCHHLFCGEATQVMRTARLGAGPRQAAAAERLRPDDSADHVPINV